MNKRGRTAPGSLDAIFAPKSIAIVGASDDPATINGRTVAYLRATFGGQILPVHPKRDHIQGLPAAARLADLDPVPDLAVVAIRAEAVLDIAEEAAAVGIPALLVFSSGFAEIGPEGADLQKRLVAVGRRSGMRVFGPNCLGVMNVPAGVLATFAEIPQPGLFRPGGTALVSQSGAFGAMLYKAAQREHIGISYFAGTGNEADVSMTEILEYFVELEDVHTVLAFAEQVSEPDRFLRVAGRARELSKPLVFMKVGRSAAGARAAVSHTGSMAGTDRVIDAVFRQHGVVRAETMQDLLCYARVFEQRRRPAGRRVGVVTISGGVGVLLTDAAIANGLQVPEFTGADRRRVAETIPTYGSAANPVDCTAQVGVNDRAALGHVLRTVAGLPAVDMICYGGLSDVPREDWLMGLDAIRTDTDKPAVVWCSTPEAQTAVSLRGIPCFLDPDGAMRALAALARFWGEAPLTSTPAPHEEERISAGRQVLARHGHLQVLLEHHARELLAGYGIPRPAEEAVVGADAAVRAADRIGYPVALKVLSHDLPHKSDVGGVRIGLHSPAQVRDAHHRLLADVATQAPTASVVGVLVQAMATVGLELVVGMHRDPQFGPIVTLGMGGTMTEIVARTASRRAPFGLDEALHALREVADGRLFTHPRGLPAGQRKGVAGLAVAVGLAATELADIAEIDLNPVIVSEAEIAVVDALVVLRNG